MKKITIKKGKVFSRSVWIIFVNNKKHSWGDTKAEAIRTANKLKKKLK